MSMSIEGADRFLDGLVGLAVTAATANTIKAKLHSETTPTTANELSGHGYKDVTVKTTDFTLGTVGSRRELRFPELEFFDPAGTSAQVGRSFGFWHGTTLIWENDVNVVPNNQRVYAPAGGVHINVSLSASTVVFQNAAIDRAFSALSGAAVSAISPKWYLHSGVPNSGNLLSGGGIGGVPAASWTDSTFNNVLRRTSQGEITFPASGSLTADTNAEPTHLALWEGDPASTGTLQLYNRITPSGMTDDGRRIIFPSGVVQISINIQGA